MLIITIIALLLGVLGIIGSIIPILPGPPLAWVGMFLLYLFDRGTNGAGEPMSGRLLLIWLIITIVVTIVDYLMPAWITKKTGGSRYAGGGAIVGMIIGLIFFPPLGVLIGPVAGAFVAELIFAGKNFGGSLRSAAGAFLGFLCGTGIKLLCSSWMLYYIFVYMG